MIDSYAAQKHEDTATNEPCQECMTHPDLFRFSNEKTGDKVFHPKCTQKVYVFQRFCLEKKMFFGSIIQLLCTLTLRDDFPRREGSNQFPL